MKFQIGDIVKGNAEAGNSYGITNEYCMGEVIDIDGELFFTLKLTKTEEGLEDYIGDEFDELMVSKFDLVKRISESANKLINL